MRVYGILGSLSNKLRTFQALLCAATIKGAFYVPLLNAQAPPGPSDTPTFRVTTRLVFLDVTVLDKKGRPVVKGLTKDDFTITESKSQQRIVSFEVPEAHVDMNPADENSSGKAPATVLVLDLLNSKFEDFAYIRNQVRKYLAAQPAQMNSPAELMVLGNLSLEMPQGYTRSKQDLLSALDHVPAALPWKLMNGFGPERTLQSIDALQQIALQNRGVPGRKNIVWVGHGAPALFTETIATGKVKDELNEYVHDTTNMLVDARMSLFVIYPGLPIQSLGSDISEISAGVDIHDDDPFAGDINFGVFVNETGGNLFYNQNDMAGNIKRSQDLGSRYYTLTHEPPEGPADGRFRRVRVTLRDPSLRVLTKAGYFAPNGDAQEYRRTHGSTDIAEAVESSLPFPALPLTIEDLVRHQDTGRVEFTVVLKSGNVVWQPADDGKSATNLTLAAASLTADRMVLASKVMSVTASAAVRIQRSWLKPQRKCP